MKIPAPPIGILIVASVIAVAGCKSPNKPPAIPGPVPLRGGKGSARADAHMRAFLVGEWRSVGKPYELQAAFSGDRRFVIHVAGTDLGTLFSGAFAEGSHRAEGTWSATSEILKLGGHRASGPAELPLTWLDGKLNIQIGGIQLRRRGAYPLPG